MKIKFMSKPIFLLTQALILCGSLQAESQVIKEDVQPVLDSLTSTDFFRDSRKDKGSEKKEQENHKVRRLSLGPNLQHLYAFNKQVGNTGTDVQDREDVPFNNGNSAFPPTPINKGTSINQINETDFLIYENGDYLVTFFGYTSGSTATEQAVQLFVNTFPTGPSAIGDPADDFLSFSQIIRIVGASLTNPAVLEVKIVLSSSGPNVTFKSGVFDGVNTTLEIVKLSPEIVTDDQ